MTTTGLTTTGLAGAEAPASLVFCGSPVMFTPYLQRCTALAPDREWDRLVSEPASSLPMVFLRETPWTLSCGYADSMVPPGMDLRFCPFDSPGEPPIELRVKTLSDFGSDDIVNSPPFSDPRTRG